MDNIESSKRSGSNPEHRNTNPEMQKALHSLQDKTAVTQFLCHLIERTEEEENAGTSLLQLAMIPKGNFTYSKELAHTLREGIQQVMQITNSLQAHIGKENEEDLMESTATKLKERISLVKENVLKQFLLDNLRDDMARLDFQKFLECSKKRLILKMNLEGMASQLMICRCIAFKDTEGARAASRTFILRTLFGLTESNDLQSDTTRNVVESLVGVHLQTMQHYVLPLLEEQIHHYATKGREKAFVDRAKETWDITRDWVMTPFNERSRHRMEKTLTPLVTMEYEGGYNQLAPIIRDLGIIAGKTSWDRGEIMSLFSTIRGTVDFDVLMIVLTLGAASAVKAAHLTGTGGKALAAVAIGGVAAARARNLVINPLRSVHGAVNLLTMEDIQKKVGDYSLEKSQVLREKIQTISNDPHIVTVVQKLRNLAEEYDLSLETVLDHTENTEVREALTAMKQAAKKHGVELPGV